MRIGEVVGQVTLCRTHPAMQGASLRLAIPMSLADLTNRSGQPVEDLVVYDELGSGEGSLIAISEGAEAAQPFRPEIKPIDAYNAGILDSIDLRTV